MSAIGVSNNGYKNITLFIDGTSALLVRFFRGLRNRPGATRCDGVRGGRTDC